MVQNKDTFQTNYVLDSSDKLNDIDDNFILNLDEDELRDEINKISDVINNGDLNLSQEEIDDLKEDLILVSHLLDKKVMMTQNINSNIENLDVVSESVDESIDDLTVSKDNLKQSDVSIVDEEVISLDGADSTGEDHIIKEEDVSIDDLTVSKDNLKQSNVPIVDEEVISLDGADSTDDYSESNVDSVDDALNMLVEDYSDDYVIKVEHVSMDFRISMDKIDSLKEFVIRTIKRDKKGYKIFRALDDVSFQISKGDRVGIIGFNGAGKSTLLKLLAGVYDPIEGTIITKGKIAPLLELGAGFDPNYTGKANIFLNGAFLGYPEEFIHEKYDEIVEFAELGEAINYHVKTYSSGMRAKLGFSIATIVEPDILIIDEILSVGDIKFRKKSADKMRSLINSGVTVLLVSHAVSQIRDLCNKAIWIDEGKVKMIGEANKVCDAYVKAADEATKEQLHNLKFD